ncbi:MAG: hypothetical protein ACM3SV_06475 [Betaproteobacteria bacterium]
MASTMMAPSSTNRTSVPDLSASMLKVFPPEKDGGQKQAPFQCVEGMEIKPL